MVDSLPSLWRWLVPPYPHLPPGAHILTARRPGPQKGVILPSNLHPFSILGPRVEARDNLFPRLSRWAHA